MDPKLLHLPEWARKGNSQLFGIVGWFSQNLVDISSVDTWHYAFGGCFRYMVADKLIIEGQLSDHLGHARMEGQMDEAHLKFKKTYLGSSDSITYEFRNENGVWVGEYLGDTDPGIKGKAKCLTTLVVEGADLLISGAPKRTR